MSKHTNRAEHGFSLIELVTVVALILIVTGWAVINMAGATQNAKANAAMDGVVNILRQARELAIAKRRNVEVQFNMPNQVTLTVLTLPGEAAPAPIAPVYLNDNAPGGSTFMLFPSLPDTPMNFGNGNAINLQQPGGGGAWTVMFTTSGAFVGTSQSAGVLYQTTNNDPVNASIFMGVQGNTNTARAVTIFGATGRVRSYHWNGSWQE
ncbi:MAG TPA: prepilin-type N-terminal cleavage/methylation domain-containing protein [Candidatus Methylomirabilis sp.]|nr:prepilin-type N-terminal cleavage/methylation domain-containing protein [Candidatus Methylomirabilis sp.]